MGTAPPTMGTCQQCEQRTLEILRVVSTVTGEPVDVGKCQQCDDRHHECGCYVQPPTAQACPRCGKPLFGDGA